MTPIRNRFEVFLWFASLLCVLLILQLLGESAYQLPSFEVDAYRTWVKNTETTIVVFTFIRVIAMYAIAYLIVATAICAVAHCTPWRRFIRIIDALTVPAARAFAVRAASLSAASALALPATTSHASASPDVPVLRHLLPSENAPSPSLPTTTNSVSASPPTLTDLPPSVTSTRTHVVQRGENFWLIAQNQLTSALERPPTDGEVTAYWRQLVELNQHRLRHSEDPDLIFPGQLIDLPERELPKSMH